MASPWKHPETGAYYLRDRVPSDIAPRVKGRKVSVPVDGRTRDVTLGEFVKVSLGTKEPKLAKELYREASAALDEMWRRFRQEAATGPVRLTAKQVEGLAGRYYHATVQATRMNRATRMDGMLDWTRSMSVARPQPDARPCMAGMLTGCCRRRA